MNNEILWKIAKNLGLDMLFVKFFYWVIGGQIDIGWHSIIGDETSKVLVNHMRTSNIYVVKEKESFFNEHNKNDSIDGCEVIDVNFMKIYFHIIIFIWTLYM